MMDENNYGKNEPVNIPSPEHESEKTVSLFSSKTSMSENPKCSVCGTTVLLNGAAFCEKCGSKITYDNSEADRCVQCGSVISPNDAFCVTCGAKATTRINQPPPPQYPPPPPPPQQQPPRPQPQPKQSSKRPVAIIIAVAVFVVILGVGLYFLLGPGSGLIPDSGDNEQDTPPVAEEQVQQPPNESTNNNNDTVIDNNYEDEITAIVITHEGQNVSNFKLDVYSRYTLHARIEPAGVDTEITWENSNPSALAVLVNSDGNEVIIRGVGPGDAELTVTAGNVVQKIETRIEKPPVTPREFIIPHSSRQRLSEQEIAHLSNAELEIAWNEIFAKHGMIFPSKALSEWFTAQPWYVPVYEYDSFNWGLTSRTEQRNVTLLRELRDKRNEGRSAYQGSGAGDIFFYQTFWDSSSRYIEANEIAGMDTGMEMALHEIYARNGRMFDNPRWSEYYSSFTWYVPEIPDHLWDDSVLNSFELANVELLRHHISIKS